MTHHVDSRCVFLPTKTRLESRFCNKEVYPTFMVALFQAAVDTESAPAMRTPQTTSAKAKQDYREPISTQTMALPLLTNTTIYI